MSDFRRRLMYKKSESELPSGYTKLNYLKSTREQYIDTNFKPTSNTKVMIDGSLYVGVDSLFGVNPYFVITSVLYKYRFRYNNKVIDSSIHATTRAVLTLDKNKAYINNELIGTFTEAEFETSQTALLFARKTASGGIEERSPSIIYYCKIWHNNILVRDYIPVLDADSKPCMFDTVSKKPFYNQGTGEFLYG